MEEVKHITVNGKYKVIIERSAVKGIDGFKVETNSDNIDEAMVQANILYVKAKELTMPLQVEVTK